MNQEQLLAAFKEHPVEEVCKLMASRIRKLRQTALLSQDEFARLAGVPLRTFKRFELEGSATLVTFVRILRAADRAQYLIQLFPATVVRTGQTPDEKIAKAKKRWQKPSSALPT